MYLWILRREGVRICMYTKKGGGSIFVCMLRRKGVCICVYTKEGGFMCLCVY